MKTLNLQQNTPEWHAHRAEHFNASDAPAMMGSSPYKSRADLLNELSTGIKPDNSDKQWIFDQGHNAEAASRPQAEDIVGEDLYPIIGTDDRLSASFDGLTMLEDINWEHKLYSASRVEMIESGDLDKAHWPQVEQQMLISGAKKTLFSISKEDGSDFTHMWYHSTPERREAVISGWALLIEDLEKYIPAEPDKTMEGALIAALPSLDVQLVGEVQSSNFPAFRSQAMILIDSVKTELVNDQDFANAETQAKFFKEAENKLADKKKAWLSQTGTLDELMREVDGVLSAMGNKRLQLVKAIKSEKEARRKAIIADAQKNLNDYIEALQEPLGTMKLPLTNVDFAGAIKGKRLLSSVRDSIDSELTRAKLDATASANSISLNIELYAGEAEGHESLFPDLQQLILKKSDDLISTIKARISDYEAAQKVVETPEQTVEQAVEPNRTTVEPTHQQTLPLTEYERGYIDGIKMRDAQLKTMVHPPTINEIIAEMNRKNAA